MGAKTCGKKLNHTFYCSKQGFNDIVAHFLSSISRSTLSSGNNHVNVD